MDNNLRFSHILALIGTLIIGFVIVNNIDNTSLKRVNTPISQTAAVADFNSSLVAHYTFDDTANDSAGSNHGTISGGATYTDGKIGRAISFDGVDDHVSTGNLNIGSSNFTISAWLKKPSGTGDFHFLDQQDGSGNHWYLEIYNDKIYWHTTTSSWVSGNPNVNSNAWNHIVIVGNDTSTLFYLNGVLDQTGAKSSDISSANTSLYIGYNPNYASHFNGSIDDIRIYNRSLSASEIAELYNYSGDGTALPYTPPSSSPINGQCGTAVNSCLPGTLSDTADSATEYLWSCLGSNGGSTASCSLPKAAEPSATPQNGVYNVKKDGTGHFTTIQACADVVKAGETCLVSTGTYSENIIPKRSGTANSPISFTASGNVTVKGFWIKNQSYINISGFEIIEGGGYDEQGYLLSGIDLVSTHHINIINNYIHNVTANGCINLERGNPSNNITIKNNRISWCINSGGTQGRGIHINGNNNLVEGNDMSHTGSYVWVKGRRNVIRNNVWYENHISDFVAGDDHMDGVAYDCAPGYNNAESIKNVLIEGNFMHDSPDRDVKFILFRDTSVPGCNPSDVVIRFNRVRDIGSYFALIADNVKNFRIYNNTVMGVGKGNSDDLPWSTINMARNSSGGKIINNIFYDTTRPYGRIYYVDESSMPGFEGRNNLAYESVCGANCSWLDPINSETGAVLSKNPQFLDTVNFAIPATSPAIDKGGALTNVSSSDPGSGNQLKVNDAGMFQDGWAGVEPDWIAVGSVGNVSRIVSINYDTNTITLATSLTRSVGASVYLYKDSSGRQVLYGSAPDIGAYEYNNGQPPPTPLTCVSFTYSAWSTCSNNQQTRTILTSTPVGCTGGTPVTTQSCTSTPIPGDFDHNGRVNSLDFSNLISVWNQANTTYDLNADRTINTLDYTIMVQNWTG